MPTSTACVYSCDLQVALVRSIQRGGHIPKATLHNGGRSKCQSHITELQLFFAFVFNPCHKTPPQLKPEPSLIFQAS